MLKLFYLGVIWVGSSDFKRKLCEHDAQCLSPAIQLVWCGSGAVVLNLGGVLLVLSPSRDNFTLMLDSPGYLCPENDGVRIITNSTHEFLQKVPQANQEIFRIGSMAPGAILVEVCTSFNFFSSSCLALFIYLFFCMTFRLLGNFRSEVIELKNTLD